MLEISEHAKTNPPLPTTLFPFSMTAGYGSLSGSVIVFKIIGPKNCSGCCCYITVTILNATKICPAMKLRFGTDIGLDTNVLFNIFVRVGGIIVRFYYDQKRMWLLESFSHIFEPLEGYL